MKEIKLSSIVINIMAVSTLHSPIIYLADSHGLSPEFIESIDTECSFAVVEHKPEEDFYLILQDDKLQLYTKQTALEGLRPLYFDFMGYWKEFLSQRGRTPNGPLAKAIGIKGSESLTVFDASCGTAKDSFLLGSFGANVVAAEQNPWIYLLLMDAFRRVENMPFEFKIHFGAAHEILPQLNDIQVVYFDPMYPHNKKKALPRKEMQYFRDIVQEVMPPAVALQALLDLRINRTVLKRPLNSPELLPRIIHSYIGKSARYDMYKSS